MNENPQKTSSQVGYLAGYPSRVYRRMDDGSLRRVSPLRPWRGKSERRRVIRARRQRFAPIGESTVNKTAALRDYIARNA